MVSPEFAWIRCEKAWRMNQNPMTPVDIFNFLEIGLWATFALVVVLFGDRANLSGRTRAILSIALLAFSWSDYVELRSGAWWRPWWLILLKGTCLACFAWVAWSVWARDGRSTSLGERSEMMPKNDSPLPEPATERK